MKLAPVPQDRQATLELRDSSTVYTCPLGDSLVPLPIELVPAGAWQFTAGQAVTLRVPPPTATEKLVVSIVVTPTTTVEVDAVVQLGEVRFAMPGLVPAQYELRVIWRSTVSLRCGDGWLVSPRRARQAFVVTGT